MTHRKIMEPISYLRYRVGNERRTERGRFEPLTFEHPLTGQHCAECGDVLTAGQRPSLFAVGPDTIEAAERAAAGEWFSALAVPMHESCAWPEDNGEAS